MSGLRSWFLATRPKTLVAALVPVTVGAAMAGADGGGIRWDLTLLALACAGALQVGTNLINDALDHRHGADTGKRLGPVRVTQSGLLAERTVLTAGLACLGAALVAGIPLVLAGGWPILVAGVLALVCAYAYTGGPWPLAYKGLAEPFVILFFGLVAVGGVHYLNRGTCPGQVLLVGLQVGLLATVLLAVNNLRDREEDMTTGKATLAVRLGPGWGRLEVALAALLPFVLQLLRRTPAGRPALVWWALVLALPVAVAPFLFSPGRIYNRILGAAAALQLLFGLLFIIDTVQP